MAVADFTGLGDCVRLYTRTGAGFSSGGAGTSITGWTDDSASAANATLANGPSAAIHNATPGGGTLGPAADHQSGANGFALGGLNLSAAANWTLSCVALSDSFGDFRDVFSSQGGAAEGSLYADASGALQYQEAGTEAIGTTLSTATVYTFILVRTASNYRLWLNGSLVWTSAATPGSGPSIVETAAYGGTGAGWDGPWWAIAAFTGDKSGDVAALHAALLEEAEGSSEQAIAGTVTPAAGQSIPTGGAVANSSALSIVGAAALALATSIPTGGTVGNISGQTITGTVTPSSGQSITTGGTLSPGSAQTITGAATPAAGQSIPTGGTVAAVTSGLNDGFGGSGALTNYTTINASSLPDVTQTSGSYRAAVTGATNNDTSHFDALYGRFDYRAKTGNFIAVYHNVRVRTPSSDTTAPTVTNQYIFAGVQVNADPANPTDLYIQATVGHRGPVAGGEGGQTLELKITSAADSAVIDIGADAVIGMALDLWVERRGGAIVFRWRTVGSSTWSADLTMPSVAYTLPSTVYVGPVTYAFNHFNPDFAGYIDQVEELDVAQTITGGVVLAGANSLPTGGAIAVGPALSVTGTTTPSNGATLITGAAVAAQSALLITGSFALVSVNSLPTGGDVASQAAQAITGSSALALGQSIPTGGSLSATQSIVGASPLVATLAIQPGGTVTVGSAISIAGTGLALATGASIPIGGSLSAVELVPIPPLLPGVQLVIGTIETI